MRVAVDDAGRQREPVGLHRFLGRAQGATALMLADRLDLAIGDAEVATHGRIAGAVVNFRILDDQVEHLGSSVAAMVVAARCVFQRHRG